MKIELFELSSIGDRKVNQDAMAHLIKKDYALFIVADGLGGHQAGEKASQFFCRAMIKLAPFHQKFLMHNPDMTFEGWIDKAIDEMRGLFADDQLADSAHTTCAILYLDKDVTITAHCGDSRIYRLNQNEVMWRTKDHSIPQLLCDEGMINEDQIAQHPDQNQLTRSINVQKQHKVDVNVHPPMMLDEAFLLCSDGFWENIKNEELIKLANVKSNKADLAKFARLSHYRAHGNGDNLTVMLVKQR